MRLPRLFIDDAVTHAESGRRMRVVGISNELLWCEWESDGKRRVSLFKERDLVLAAYDEVAEPSADQTEPDCAFHHILSPNSTWIKTR